MRLRRLKSARREGRELTTSDCPNCGWENRRGAAFCGRCGARIVEVNACPRCSSANPRGQKYCNACGIQLTPGLHTGASQGDASRAPAPAAPAPHEPHAVAPQPARRPMPLWSWGRGYALAAGVAAFAAVAALRIVAASSASVGILPQERALLDASRSIADGAFAAPFDQIIAGAPTGYAYVLAAWSFAAGSGIEGARLLSSVMAAAALVPCFLFARRLFGARAAVIAVMLMAVSAWTLVYSGLALAVSAFLFLEALALYLFFTAEDQTPDHPRRLVWYAAAGAVVGISAYAHIGGLILAAVACCLWARSYVAGDWDADELRRRFLAFAVAALVVSAPLWLTLAASADARESLGALLVTSGESYALQDGVMPKLRFVAGNIVNAARSLVWIPGAGGSAIDPVTALLAALGVGLCIRERRRRGPAALLVMVCVVSAFVGLTREEGAYSRLIVGAPAAFCLAALALDCVLSWLRGRAPAFGAVALGALALAAILAFNLGRLGGDPIENDPTRWANAEARTAAEYAAASP